MLKSWQSVREFLPIAAVILLCLLVVPILQSGNDGETSIATTAQKGTPPVATVTPPAETAKQTKPQEKSALDSETLDSSVSYFKKAFHLEEDEQDATSDSSAVMITIKALIATLLSTIM